MRSFVVKSALMLTILSGHSAMAADTIVLLDAPEKSPIKSIGIVPEKKLVELDLGELRNEEAELPFTSTVKSRMKKRLRIARQRQRSVGSAKRAGNDGELRFSKKPKQSFQPESGNGPVTDELPEGAFEQPTPFDN